MDNQEIKNAISQFCGKNDENTSKSIMTMQIYAIDKNKSMDEAKLIATFATSKLFSEVKILNSYITLTLNYENPYDEEYNKLISLMDIYNLLKGEKNIETVQIITLVEDKELSENQLLFINPIYNIKNSNIVGRPINGFRMAYNFEDVLLQNATDESLRNALYEEMGE